MVAVHGLHKEFTLVSSGIQSLLGLANVLHYSLDGSAELKKLQSQFEGIRKATEGARSQQEATDSSQE